MKAFLQQWARSLKADTIALWFCCRHADTPKVAKIMAAIVVAYALSPIDLIPDFIPVLGYLDDIILVPIGIWLTLKLVPPHVMEQCRSQARIWIEAHHAKPRNYVAAAAIVLIWIALLYWLWLSIGDDFITWLDRR